MASLDTVNEILDDFGKFYDRKQSSAQRLFYEAAVKDLDDDLLCKAVMRLKQHEPPNRMPSIDVIRRYYFEEKDAVWQKQKEQAPIFEDLKRNAERTEHGREAIALMIALSEGRLTRDQYITEMFAMDRKYPNLGWAKQANELKAFWDSEAERHAAGKRYFERVYAESDADLNRRKEKLHSQADWLKKNLGDPQ